MTSSGTYTFGSAAESNDLITEAYERVGIFGSSLQSLHVQSAVRSLNLLFSDWANMGPNLWAIDQQTQALAASTPSYNLPAGTVDILECNVRQDSNDRDVPMARISRSEYFALSNKAEESTKPSVFYVERTLTPKVYIWQVPIDTGFTLVYNRLRLMQDVTEILSQTLDAPNRWMEAIAAGLAAKLAVKWAPDRVQMLQGLADRAYKTAAGEDRERVPFRLYPDLSGMTV